MIFGVKCTTIPHLWWTDTTPLQSNQLHIISITVSAAILLHCNYIQIEHDLVTYDTRSLRAQIPRSFSHVGTHCVMHSIEVIPR